MQCEDSIFGRCYFSFVCKTDGVNLGLQCTIVFLYPLYYWVPVVQVFLEPGLRYFKNELCFSVYIVCIQKIYIGIKLVTTELKNLLQKSEDL